MLKENQFIKVKWRGDTKQHFVDKGYVFTKNGDEFLVKAEDLTKGSHKEVEVFCDYCGKIIIKQYSAYISQHDNQFGDCCCSCVPIKNSQICFEKYGEYNPSQVKKFKDKRKETFIDRFGCENPSQSELVKQKRVDTYLKHYGVDHPLKSIEVQEKSKTTCLKKYGTEYTTQTDNMKKKSRQTCLERYGVDNASKSDIVKSKIEETWMRKYGVKNIMELDEFREKILQSFVRNNSCPTSSMQIALSNLLKEIYGDENVEDNVVCGSCLLDMVLKHQGYIIDVEYDGWFWHKNKQEKDTRRNYYVKSQGYKILRVRSNIELPTKEQIQEAIDYLVKDNHSLKFINLDI